MKSSPRIRRTPEQAKKLILEAAQERLLDHGLRGLTIKDVAAETNMNHGTLLHHFGSAEGMRIALLQKMTRELIQDMRALLSSNPTTEDSVAQLFELMESTGHIKLLSWRAMEDTEKVHSLESDDLADLGSIVEQITAELDDHDQNRARNMMFFAVSTAVGWGICGGGFQKMFGLSPTQQAEFPRWVGEQMERLTSPDSD